MADCSRTDRSLFLRGAGLDWALRGWDFSPSGVAAILRDQPTVGHVTHVASAGAGRLLP